MINRYDVGTRVRAGALKSGDLYGEERVARVTDRPATGRNEPHVTIELGSGLIFTARADENLVVPQPHYVQVTNTARENSRFWFTCTAPPGSYCRRVCGGCGRHGGADRCVCRTPDGQPQRDPGVDSGLCQLAAWCNNPDNATWIRLNHVPAPPRSGPVAVDLRPNGECVWSIPAPPPGTGDENGDIATPCGDDDPDVMLARFRALQRDIDDEIASYDVDDDRAEPPDDCADHHDRLAELHREASDLAAALDTHLTAGGRPPHAWATAHTDTA